MKIKLPHRELIITEEQKMMSGKEKVQFVNQILQEEFEVDNEVVTLDLYLAERKHIPSTSVISDMLGYFITKEHRKKEDIMTRETIKKMQRGDGRTFNFSNVSAGDQIKYGLTDVEVNE